MDGDDQRRFRQPLLDLQETDIKVLAVGIENPGKTPIPKLQGGECIDEYIEVDGQTVGVPLVPEFTPASVTQRENQQNIASLRSFQLGVQLAQMALSR